jgi:hypothetical protein
VILLNIAAVYLTFGNHRALLEAKNASLDSIEFGFLEFKEPETKISKMRFNIHTSVNR